MAALLLVMVHAPPAAGEAGPTDATVAPRLPDRETPCFPIRQIEWRGDAAERFGWLAGMLAGPQGADGPWGRCIGATGIGVLVQRAQHALTARGLVTSRVLVEPQDLTQGTLRLTVLPGRIRRARFSDTTTRVPWVLNALPARPGDLLDLRDIEQALENLRRAPSVEADMEIVPADEPGHSDLVIRWSQRRPVRLQLSADDGGSRSTGRYQGSAALHLDNPLALNDLFQLGLQGSLGGGAPGRRAARGSSWHYSLPWGRALLAIDVTRHRYRQTVAGASQDYVYRGTSGAQQVTLSWLAHRNAARKTTLHAKAFAQQACNFIDDTEVEVQRSRVGGWQMGVGHRTFVGQGTFELSLSYHRGTGAFGSIPAPEEDFGEGTARFALIRGHVQAQWPFKLGAQPWTYSGQWRAQMHRTPLSPHDRFAIGGRHSVRGFDGEASLSAESGWVWRNELSTPLGGSGLAVFAGLDHGRVRGPSAPLLVGTRLTGAVVGLRSREDRDSSTHGEVFAGWPLRMPDGFRTASTTLGFWLAATF